MSQSGTPEIHIGIADSAERAAIIGVRHRAYAAAGKVAPGAAPEAFWDEYDSDATIIVARHRHRVVGSVRVIVPGDDRTPSIARYFGDSVPPELPARSDYLEASRMCVDPDYQGHGLIWRLAAAMVRVAATSGRSYLIGGATESLYPRWREVGFRLLGRTYVSSTLNDVPHELLILDLRRVARGEGVSARFASYLAASQDSLRGG